MALPNPQNKLVDNTGKQVQTLGDIFRVQEDVEKWSQNTDINTFRAAADAQKGFQGLKKGLSSEGAIAKGIQQSVIKPGRSIDDATDEVKEGLGGVDAFLRTFRAFLKPFAAVTENLSSVAFSKIGPSFFSVTQASERMNAGFKEVTNGIGEFGPAINAIRTQVFKAVGVFNIFLGAVQFVTAGILSIPSLIAGAFKRIRSMFKIKDDPQSLADAEQKFVEQDQDVKEAEQKLSDLGTEPKRAEVTLIEGTPNYYRDMALANQAQKGDLLLGIGGQEQARLDKEFAEQKAAAEKNLLEKKQKAEEKYRNKRFSFQKIQSLKRFAFEKGLLLKKFAFESLMVMGKFLLPIIVIVGAFAAAFALIKDKIQSFVDLPIAGIASGLKTALTEAGQMAKNLFSKLGSFLTKLGLLPKTTPKPPKPTTPKPGTKPPTATKTATQTLKSVGGQVVKKLPIVGAGVETVMDATSNEKKFARIKDAYENNQPIIPDENGELRPMTAEEFAAAEASMSANRAGSVGRGAGAFGGAAAGAATGAAIGSVIPIVGTAIGGIIGGVLGGFFGGRKGDEIATNLANQAEGIDDPQAYIDMLAANVPELQNEAGAELAGAQGEVADATMANNTGGSMNNQQFNQTDNSSSNTFNGSEIPVSDQQADYSYA